MIEQWIFLAIVLFIIEILTSNLVTIWFAAGALVTGIFSLFVKDTSIQIIIFLIVSTLSLILTKPVVKKLKSKIVPTNLDRVIGKIGIVTEDITKLEPGEVKVDGKKWSAISTKKITKGSKVEILAIDGVKLKVKEVEE